MENIVKEYNQWLKENQNFILHLKKHDSSLYSRVAPIYEVLNFLSVESTENGIELTEDLLKIYQVGFEYLHSQVSTCKLYLDKEFGHNLHNFIEYDRVVGYILYLEDLRYELEENNLEVNEKTLNDLMDYLERILVKKEGVPDNAQLYVDSEVHKIADVDHFNFSSIIDIFVEIAETLGIDIYSEEEYVLGKEI